MRLTKYIALSCMSIFMMASCKNEKHDDQKELAESINDEKFGKNTEKDAQFLVDAATVSLKEISLGELALTKATMAETKDMANMMILDHQKALKEATAMGSQKGFVIPNQLSDEAMGDRDKLQDKEGADFDKEYADMMVKGHKDAIDKFEKAIKDTQDPDISSWASATLTTLRAHLAMAEKCDEMNKDHNMDGNNKTDGKQIK